MYSSQNDEPVFFLCQSEQFLFDNKLIVCLLLYLLYLPDPHIMVVSTAAQHGSGGGSEEVQPPHPILMTCEYKAL